MLLLQEVEEPRFLEHLRPLLSSKGYESTFGLRQTVEFRRGELDEEGPGSGGLAGGRTPDGNAVVYRTAAFDCVWSRVLTMPDLVSLGGQR